LNVGGTWVTASGMTLSAASGDARGMSFVLNGLSGLTVNAFSYFNMVGTIIVQVTSEL
jgi:hypothetical protein